MEKRKFTKKEAKYMLSKASEVLSKSLMNLLIPQKPSNSVIQLKDGYISFNGATDCGGETAICFKNVFYILLGDFRKELKGLKTYEECIKVFDKLLKTKKAKLSPWSSYKNK